MKDTLTETLLENIRQGILVAEITINGIVPRERNMEKAQQEAEFITQFRYLRDKNNRPVITLCRAEYGDQKGYGWAICSTRDNPCKKTGKAIAAERARTALQAARMENALWAFWRRKIIRDEAYNAIHSLAATELGKLADFFSRDLVRSSSLFCSSSKKA